MVGQRLALATLPAVSNEFPRMWERFSLHIAFTSSLAHYYPASTPTQGHPLLRFFFDSFMFCGKLENTEALGCAGSRSSQETNGTNHA
jgi:hypothetical protein